MFWSAECSLLRAEGFSCSLCILYGGLRISKLPFSIKKYKKSFTAVIFQFWSSKPWIRNWIWIRIRNEEKCGLRIRIKSMQINNPGLDIFIKGHPKSNEGWSSPGAAAVAAARPPLLPPAGGAEHPAPAAAAAGAAREEAGQREPPVIWSAAWRAAGRRDGVHHRRRQPPLAGADRQVPPAWVAAD